MYIWVTAGRILPKNLPVHITVKVTGKRPEWSDKRQINYGSDDYYVDVIDIIVID